MNRSGAITRLTGTITPAMLTLSVGACSPELSLPPVPPPAPVRAEHKSRVPQGIRDPAWLRAAWSEIANAEPVDLCVLTARPVPFADKLVRVSGTFSAGIHELLFARTACASQAPAIELDMVSIETFSRSGALKIFRAASFQSDRADSVDAIVVARFAGPTGTGWGYWRRETLLTIVSIEHASMRQ